MGFSLAALALPAAAQVLARPGWAGSGVAPESWWRRAVFYRVDPSRFQDSDGDGKGDLAGMAQRLDYLQSVGVDALLLDGDEATGNLDDLIREASRHHLRLVLTVDTKAAQQPRTALLNTVRGWLSAGAAGIFLPKHGESETDNSTYAALVATLRQTLQSFPGERVLLCDPAPTPLNMGPRPLRLGRSAEAGGSIAGQLATAAELPVRTATVSQLRIMLSSASQAQGPEGTPLLRFAEDPPTGAPNAVADAAILLASRGAAVFDFGSEIGLDTYPVSHPQVSGSGAGPSPVMQWTPSNRTPAVVATTEKPVAAAGSEPEFGAYHPYQPPPRALLGGMPGPAQVTPDKNVPVAPPDADTLPGFTAGTLPAPPLDGALRNVVTQDRDPHSMLNAYRQLIGLHHDNATLRNGTQVMLNHDAEGALVWIRRAPAGSRTVANVLAALNLTDNPVVLSLDSELQAQGMRPGALRPLFTYAWEPITGQTTSHLLLPPHAVLLGEVVHAGAYSAPEPVAHARRHGRRHRR